jgi:hypothetical protein
MGTLHVPTRRENFNSHVSISLGNDKVEIACDKPIETKKYSVRTRFDNNPKNTLNVHDLKSSKAFNDLERCTMREHFNKVSEKAESLSNLS